MEFRLTYEGPLRSSGPGKDEKKSNKDHKHTIRQSFHSQLKILWEIIPHLRNGTSGGPIAFVDDPLPSNPPATTIEALAKRHAHYGFNFVPIVTSELDLACSVEILYLRKAKPGEVLQATGDIDNRLKTLFDALQIPDAHQLYEDRAPSEDEKPFFCLLENDKLITKASVETDWLLSEVNNPHGDHENNCRLIITVRIRPTSTHLWNIQFS